MVISRIRELTDTFLYQDHILIIGYGYGPGQVLAVKVASKIVCWSWWLVIHLSFAFTSIYFETHDLFRNGHVPNQVIADMELYAGQVLTVMAMW